MAPFLGRSLKITMKVSLMRKIMKIYFQPCLKVNPASKIR